MSYEVKQIEWLAMEDQSPVAEKTWGKVHRNKVYVCLGLGFYYKHL